jgi:FkbM family methyltransferase
MRNAFLSRGRQLFGLGFAFDYLRFAWRARRMNSIGPGSLDLAGFRIDFLNQSHALFLLHEIFVNAEYEFGATTARPRIVDCGANIGMSVVFFKALYPEADIVAFEPDAGAFTLLRRAIDTNRLRRVSAEQAAVTETGGTVAFYTNSADPASIVGSIDPSWSGGTREDVRAVRLSERITAPVDFLKLDIEGAEYGVIRDLVSTGAIRWVREAVIEYHDVASEPHGLDELSNALTTSGFRLERSASDGPLPVGVIRASR